jgi:hypothetical protein
MKKTTGKMRTNRDNIANLLAARNGNAPVKHEIMAAFHFGICGQAIRVKPT